MKLEQIIGLLQKATHVLVGAHVSPDGDAIGAMTGMGYILEALGVPYTMLLESEHPKLSYMTEYVNVQSSYEGEYDCFVSVDCGDLGRLGPYVSYFQKAQQTINIDHHVTNDKFAMYNYVEAEASSTCEIIYQLVKAGNIMIHENLAKALYTGLVTDTGGFMHPCTHTSTLLAAAELIGYGFDFSSIYHKLIHEKSLQTLYIENVAIGRMQVLGHQNVYLTYITEQDMLKYGATKHDLESVISAIRNVEGAEIAALIYPLKEQDTYKLSTRSIAPYDVAKLCQSFGGGGHQRAAGATLVGKLDGLMKQVGERLEDLVSEHQKG
ncbi:MAG: DHH family phosphoesterase [Cellulosilyticaceae bacterium]